MPPCVFMHKADSIYDDVPAERYQFPKPYLSRAQHCVGGWIVYLEPTWFFRWAVLQAYDARCAATGRKLINGGGRAEAQAAHIRPVEDRALDVRSRADRVFG